MPRKRTEENKDKWWIKPPRSSRVCYRCEHKYSSHIDVRCLKIVSRNPRVECECRGFVANKVEMDMILGQQARKKARLEQEKSIKIEQVNT